MDNPKYLEHFDTQRYYELGIGIGQSRGGLLCSNMSGAPSRRMGRSGGYPNGQGQELSAGFLTDISVL